MLRVLKVQRIMDIYIYGDNVIIVHNSTRVESVLRKKRNTVCYHKVCKSDAMGKSLVGFIFNKENVPDLMTKVLYGQQRMYLVSNILYDIHDAH